MADDEDIGRETSAASLPDAKRVRIAREDDFSPREAVPRLLESSDLPASLLSIGPAGNNLDKLRQLLDNHGFRTAKISSPRQGISVYKDSFQQYEGNDEGKNFLIAMFGLHPDQVVMEKIYEKEVKKPYCLLLFCRRLREICHRAMKNPKLAKQVIDTERNCRSFETKTEETRQYLSSLEQVTAIIQLAVQVDSRLRPEQLQREYDCIDVWNSTLSNAFLQRFVQAHSCVIHSIQFKPSHLPIYERITVSLYDADTDHSKPFRFCFLPSLTVALTDGANVLTEQMITSFWAALLRQGYYATQQLQQDLEPQLRRYFLSGITKDPSLPLSLNAHFTPTYPLALYLYGKAGSGKSSLARNFCPSLHASIAQHMDPELTVRLVKQNLNKDLDTLQLELDLRPNNNDLSVMSIIQGRQCSMRQSKPGLVLVDLEEMPDTQTQVAVAQLLSQRFAGRKGSYGSNQARNSNKRGISGDAKIAAIFTSNYELSQESQQALQSIEMFSNLHPVHLKAVSGVEREQFARTYLQQRVQDRLSTVEHCHVNLDMSLGQGDTRLLVRKLRMLAFYVCAVAQGNLKAVGPLQTSVVQTKRSYHVAVGMDTLQLKTGLLETLLPLAPQIFNKRTGEAMDLFTQSSNGDPVVACDGLSMVLEYWFSNTLAPAVIISRNPRMVSRVAEAVASLANVHSILGVDAGSYKIMKSLYDQKDTPNLREDILKFGRGAQVAVELHCETTEAQMAIRELIEDTPSMTAFSSERSALYKRGLLFLVYCKDEITPEILSRASLVM